MQDEHGAADVGGEYGGRARDEDRVGRARQRQLTPLAGAPRERFAELRGDLRVPHDLEVVAPLGGLLELQHPARGAVDEQEPALLVDHEHAFDHAAQDRGHARAVGFELGGAPCHLTDRVVQHPRDRADFVGAVVARRLGDIAGRVPLGDPADRADAPREQRRGGPREPDGRQQPHTQGDQRQAPHRGELIADRGHRQRQAHLGQPG